MARGVEMCIPQFKWIHAGNGRLQEFRIRFPIIDSYLGETLCQQGCKRMISGQMLFDTRLVRDEDHKKLRMASFDRLLQFFKIARVNSMPLRSASDTTTSASNGFGCFRWSVLINARTPSLQKS